jgi:hypothetical protein
MLINISINEEVDYLPVLVTGTYNLSWGMSND